MAQARAGCQGCRHYPRAGPASLLLAPGNLTFCSEPTLGGCPKTEDERLGLGPRPCILQGRPSVIPQLCSSAPALQGRLVMSRDRKGPWHGHFLPLLTSQHTPGCELCPTLPPCLLLCTPQPGESLLTHWVLTWGNPMGLLCPPPGPRVSGQVDPFPRVPVVGKTMAEPTLHSQFWETRYVI